jgi:hypothetical protein
VTSKASIKLEDKKKDNSKKGDAGMETLMIQIEEQFD